MCDTLTGNVIVKLFSAFNTGGEFEVLGWGYGPSVGENWARIVSIVSRASGAPVIANALCYTASVIRGNSVLVSRGSSQPPRPQGWMRSSASLAAKPVYEEETCRHLRQQPTDSEIQGIDVLSIEAAVKEFWKAGIYAESAMGCTGPVVKVPGSSVERSKEVLSKDSAIYEGWRYRSTYPRAEISSMDFTINAENFEAERA